MATHRRGLRPSQWPVRDLLGPDAGPARLWDARVGAAVAGLLACGTAVTVVLTSSGQAVSQQPTPPQALPQPPAAPLPAPPPPGPVPPPAPPPVAPPAAAAPSSPPQVARPRTGERNEAPSRSRDRAVAEQVTTELDRDDRPKSGRSDGDRWKDDHAVAGSVLVPVPRAADAAALLHLADGDEHRRGRHRARDVEVVLRVDHRAERDEADEDDDRRGRHHRSDDADDDCVEFTWFAGDRTDDGDDDRDDDRADDRDGFDWFAAEHEDVDDRDDDADWDWFAGGDRDHDHHDDHDDHDDHDRAGHGDDRGGDHGEAAEDGGHDDSDDDDDHDAADHRADHHDADEADTDR